MMIGSPGVSLYVRALPPFQQHVYRCQTQNSTLRPLLADRMACDNLYFKSLAHLGASGPVSRGRGGPQVGQADKGLSGFEILPRPLHRKKYQYKMT